MTRRRLRFKDGPFRTTPRLAIAVRVAFGSHGWRTKVLTWIFIPVDRDVMEPDRFRRHECLCGGERTYVDGGVIANFPAFIFGDQFRRWLAATAPTRFHVNVMRAWAHVGLGQFAEEEKTFARESCGLQMNDTPVADLVAPL